MSETQFETESFGAQLFLRSLQHIFTACAKPKLLFSTAVGNLNKVADTRDH